LKASASVFKLKGDADGYFEAVGCAGWVVGADLTAAAEDDQTVSVSGP
jgi:hypothetical protein